MSTDLLGTPRLGAVLLYIAGAVTAFLALEFVAYREYRVRLSTGTPPPVAVWANAHLLSAGGAVMAVWGAGHAFRGELFGWLVAGFLATGVYLTLNAVQATLGTQR